MLPSWFNISASSSISNLQNRNFIRLILLWEVYCCFSQSGLVSIRTSDIYLIDRNLVKKQLTWFRHDNHNEVGLFHWVDASQPLVSVFWDITKTHNLCYILRAIVGGDFRSLWVLPWGAICSTRDLFEGLQLVKTVNSVFFPACPALRNAHLHCCRRILLGLWRKSIGGALISPQNWRGVKHERMLAIRKEKFWSITKLQTGLASFCLFAILVFCNTPTL